MCLSARQSSRGFLIPLAAILILGFGVLAIAINRFAAYSPQSAVLEGISIQSFYAAESGAYAGLSRLMFDVDDRVVADANCNAINAAAAISFSVTGLNGCSASVSCSISSVSGNPQHFYSIRSVGVCGSGALNAERIVQVSAYL